MSEKYTQVLPSNWDGRFPFTNDSDEEFVFVWAKKAYVFPARKTVDMMRMAFNATPLEVQQIRKFAAKKWAEEQFFKSGKYQSIRAKEGSYDENGVMQPRLQSFHSAGSYSNEAELMEGIQKCLQPFPEVSAMMKEGVVEARSGQGLQTTDELLHKDDEGNYINKVIDKQNQSVAPGEILIN